MGDAAPRFDDLSEHDQQRLEAAHRDLSAAVAAYERFVGGPLQSGQPTPVVDARGMRSAQEAVEAAEQHLWQLRGELLGWARPAWAPSALLTADWFSDEDAVYDGLAETNS